MKKQVLLIMTDTTRKDMLGCYGNQNMKTPNLDRLAQEGIRYERAYTCQPVCGPARSAIFTGTFPHTNGMVTNSVALRADVKTIGQQLCAGHIPCGYIGKWHLDGWDYFGKGECPDGWDPEYWYDMKCYLEELDESQRVKSRNPQTSYEPDMEEGFTYAHRCSDRAIRFLEQHRNQDFFLTVSYDEPHGPSLCPAPFCTMYDGFCFPDYPEFADGLSEKPMMQRLWAGKNLYAPAEEINRPSKALSLFLGCNSFVDYEIGRVLDKLKEAAPDAMVIYTSDHGDMLGAHRLFSKNATAYKEVANIPLIIKGGERGKVVTEPASHIDLAPTILDYFGLSIPNYMEGVSMLPQIYDVSRKIHDMVFTEFTRYEVDHDGFGGLQLMRAVITDRYKLVIHLLDTDEFYDLEEDPYEIHNRIEEDSCRDIRDQLHDRLLEHMNETRDLYRGYQWAARSWRSDRIPDWENEGCTRQRREESGEPRQLDYDTGLPMVSEIRKKRL
ncbi:MAG: sulfatase-like hydrolase/transferase [Lachnospiraceae bacterium]|nr:sulfatase-like hydrolase/transferase [Lachnospiraceae bacterium]